MGTISINLTSQAKARAFKSNILVAHFQASAAVTASAMSLQQLSEELGVSSAEIMCAVPAASNCKSKGCARPAILPNYNKYAWCRKGWFPVSPEPGYLLLGPEYMNQFSFSGRIVIEQVNGGAKTGTRWITSPVAMTQLDLASAIIRIGVMMQNFRSPFTVGIQKGPGTQGHPEEQVVVMVVRAA